MITAIFIIILIAYISIMISVLVGPGIPKISLKELEARRDKELEMHKPCCLIVKKWQDRIDDYQAKRHVIYIDFASDPGPSCTCWWETVETRKLYHDSLAHIKKVLKEKRNVGYLSE